LQVVGAIAFDIDVDGPGIVETSESPVAS
jgi:hypothetical protein